MRTAASPFVFMYHGVVPRQRGLRSEDLGVVYRDDFERHLASIRRRFTVLHPEECADRLERGLPPPPRSALVTLDDGFQNLIDHALPAAQAAGIVPLAFVSTGHLSRAGWLWFGRLCSSRHAGPRDLVPLFQRLPRLPLARIESWLEEQGAPRWEVSSPLSHLLFDGADAEALRREVRKGMLCLGGHTVRHPFLPQEDADVKRAEIRENKRVLEEIGGRPVRLFAYPSGAVDEDSARAVRDAGYAAAFAILPPAPEFPDDLARFHLPRTGIQAPGRILFLLKCAGIDAWRWRAGLLR